MTTIDGSQRPNVPEILSGLKEFQRDTVEYVFRRLYLDEDRVSRFLIADEVGLGKTLVARGVIAKAIDHLWDQEDLRIDVIYICSNQDIARQNIDRLNITDERRFQFAARATLLPVTLHELQGNKLNFVSLTPGTSFNLRSSTGVAWERIVLYHLVRKAWQVQDGTLSNVLRGDMQKRNWKYRLNLFRRTEEIDAELEAAFMADLVTEAWLRTEYEALAQEIGSRRTRLSAELRSSRNGWIGALRRLLARSSLNKLEPDLIILDEFQRFRNLLDPDSELAPLAQELFTFPNAKTLLLSATPYKMYTVQEERGENHYEDFLETVRFLFKGAPDDLRALQGAIDAYRNGLFRLVLDQERGVVQAKQRIEQILRGVMVRTERLAATSNRNGMLTEIRTIPEEIRPTDLEAFIRLDTIARSIQAGDQIEFWKSSAYPINLMDDYQLKKKFEQALTEHGPPELSDHLKRAAPYLLNWQDFQTYQKIDPGNARLRALFAQTLDTQNWKLLWMPASCPYYRPGGVFARLTTPGKTKTLVFSAWRLVPKVIAMLASYEAERRMVAQNEQERFRYSELAQRRRSLLNFTFSNERLTGMPVFCLIFPSTTLAKEIDPLSLARRVQNGESADFGVVLEQAKQQVARLLEEATASFSAADSGLPDERWYWVALALLDRHFNKYDVHNWLETADENLAWDRMLDKNPEEPRETRYVEHVQLFRDTFAELPQLGRRPDDLVEVLSQVALVGPATVALRALVRRNPPMATEDWSPFLAAAASVGLGFRSLFNTPEAISLLMEQYPDHPYWKKVLLYAADGNLQSVLDEYTHLLNESLGLIGHDSGEYATKIGETIHRTLSLRSPSLRFDEIVFPENPGMPTLEKHAIRCRYALQFGDDRTDDLGQTHRADDVRAAFNSPFRPFVLATTSIGQEGLDFHHYCHRVVHWNLPANPVDLEQREGRVHRYKGHVIRRNLGRKYIPNSIDLTDTPHVDVWEQLFLQADQEHGTGSKGLIPYWIYEAEDGHSIERHLPMLPLSREVTQIEQLKRSVVSYRAVFGQPRQEELLQYLQEKLSDDEFSHVINSFLIDLSPPRSRQ